MIAAVEVRMPRLSESMAEGTIVRWLHEAGAQVGAGDALAEIETDKATVAFEADAAGVLEIVVAEGGSAPVGAVIARIGGSPDPVVAPARPIASPLARRRARELGVDLPAITGTGPGGRIVQADVVAAAPPQTAEVAPVPPKPVPPKPVPLTRVQQAGLRRLAVAVPVFTLTAEADMSAARRLRVDLAEISDPAPTVTDLVVTAAGRALRAFPRINASAADGAVLLHEHVHVGIAVETPQGLLVPVVRDADRCSPAAVAARTRELVQRARAGAATPSDLDGATFTVSNLGMFGVVAFEAVLVAPQAAILAVGAVRDLPRIRDGQVVGVPVMALTLTCDHRVVDGAVAARFLARLVALLQRPLALFVEGGNP